MVSHGRLAFLQVEPCPQHGLQLMRASCKPCNASYMRAYLRHQRVHQPEIPILERARRRAAKKGMQFDLTRGDIYIPACCPVLGLPLVLAEARSACSPSLDRINPAGGYIRGNVRVISDKANRLKGDRSLIELRALSQVAKPATRSDYGKVVAYVEREDLLRVLTSKANDDTPLSADWRVIANFLNSRCAGRR